MTSHESVPASPREHALPEPAQRAIEAYQTHLAHPRDLRPITVAWAPGRVNLIGEHTDYNDGYVLPVAVDRVVALAGRPTPLAPGAIPRARLHSLHHEQTRAFACDRDALLADTSAARGPLWVRYVRSVLGELVREQPSPESPVTPGFAAAIAGNVPVGGGMSSSAALEVAVATFAAALGGPAFPPMVTAQLCQRAEQRGAGVRVGIMDQATSCLGKPDNALLLDCRSLSYEYIPLHLPDVALAVYDTRVPHSLAGSAYNERRDQCEEAVALLGAAIRREDPARATPRALRDVTPADLQRYASVLPDLLLHRACHVVSENARVLEAAAALRAGDLDTLGTLLYASHASLRDDYAVSCFELDAVVEIARSVPGVVGARMMGAGFGGSALILVRETALARLGTTLAEEYPRRTRRAGMLHVCRVSGGPEHTTIRLDNA